MAKLSDAEASDLIETARACAEAARPETLRHFRQSDLLRSSKGAGAFDPVTEADRGAELAIREVLKSRRPDDAILGEEFERTAGTSGLTWVIDPIDGTRGYVAGTPTWGTLISVADVYGPVFGIIDQPYIGERFEGGLGQACLVGRNGTLPLETALPRALDEAILFTTFPEIGTAAEARAFQAVASQVQLVRYGMDCYAYALVALGLADLVIEAGLQPYDIHAPIAVVEAAGGIVTDWRGGPAIDGGQVIAAANPQIHAAALAILSRALDG